MGWSLRENAPLVMKYIATIDGTKYEFEINTDDEIITEGRSVSVDFQSVADQPIYSLILDGRSYEANVHPSDAGVEVLFHGELYIVNVEDERQRRLRESSGGSQVEAGEYKLTAPMPGLVVAVPVERGDSVDKGVNLVILESMKMQNELKSPRAGTVTGIQVEPGDRVEKNQVMVTLS
jgi:biotin carboxyl carrier protein